MENKVEILDLSGRKIKRINKPNFNDPQVTTLILDDNELQSLNNVDSYTKVEKLSIIRNQLERMYWVCRLHALHTLNLAHNAIRTIEGLKELINLKHLCLAGNYIETIENLTGNIHLEHLDLSNNNISCISDISFLTNLQELFLHSNRINSLKNCERFLPTSLNSFTLASNNICDLNEISQLVNLVNLTNFSIANNPCINMTGGNVGFNYRPFIINWCMNVKVIDGYVVNDIESLKAEWLYSQGRGKQFRIGDHKELVQYLASVCPMSGETLETEEDKKLRLILSKAQQHQKQLREQQTTSNGIMESASSSPASRRRLSSSSSNSNRNSPRLNSSRLSSNRKKSPDRMSVSYFSNSGGFDNSRLMSQSLDPKMLSQSVVSKCPNEEPVVPIRKHCVHEGNELHSPLKAVTKLIPVPESLMSPDYHANNSFPTRLVAGAQPVCNRQLFPKRDNANSPKIVKGIVTQKPKNSTESKSYSPPCLRFSHAKLDTKKPSSTSSEDELEFCIAKMQSIKNVQKISMEKSIADEIEKQKKQEKMKHAAATVIQKMWKGYRTRNLNQKVIQVLRTIDHQRTREHIQKLSSDMESTKLALESERKIQMLQMQAINALWKKVSNIQSPPKSDSFAAHNNLEKSNDNLEVIKELSETCIMLHSQVTQLQESMQDVIKYISTFCQTKSAPPYDKEVEIGTQTEIIAVQTPQNEGKNFPFQKTPPRPSSLPLPVSQKKQNSSNAPQEVKQFAGSLVDDVIKTVAETSIDNSTEITITDTETLNSADESNECDLTTITIDSS